MDRQQIADLLHEQKFRLTQEREVILGLFASAGTMLTPGQLYELARAKNIKIGLTTVYRLLEALTKVGVATPFLLDGDIFYAFCGGGHHHHFVCLSCHRILDLQGCPSFTGIPENYQIEDHRADLFGTCPSCRNTHDRSHYSC